MNRPLPKNWLRMVGMLAAFATSIASHADKIYFVHNDHLGTPQVITDENKRVVWEVDRDPWGNITNVITNTLPNNVSLPGQYDDAETNYSDNWHRSYDKQLGQYLQFDPIGLHGGMHPYGYAFNDPVGYADPTGLIGVSFGGNAPTGTGFGGGGEGGITEIECCSKSTNTKFKNRYMYWEAGPSWGLAAKAGLSWTLVDFDAGEMPSCDNLHPAPWRLDFLVISISPKSLSVNTGLAASYRVNVVKGYKLVDSYDTKTPCKNCP